ncbi:MAG: hypothetical protein O7D97_00135 [Planctomycetota bacterium]|nr:hypothetical protein [Planctomycetota bacterium]
MARSMSMTGAALVGAISACAVAAAGGQILLAEPNAPSIVTGAEAQPAPQPLALFDQLVERYWRLSAYEDLTHIVQITTREGQAPHRVETRIACRIDNDTLRIETPGSQVREGIGLDTPLKKSPAMDALVLRYNLWLAPHMALRFTDDPLKEFRLGVKEGFTPTKAEHVTAEKKQWVRLELKSGDGLSEDYTARFDLFVNLQSMLVERIEGEQRLPDGAEYRTTLDITPILTEQAEPVNQSQSTD